MFGFFGEWQSFFGDTGRLKAVKNTIMSVVTLLVTYIFTYLIISILGMFTVFMWREREHFG
jgi:hypothetical protein